MLLIVQICTPTLHQWLKRYNFFLRCAKVGYYFLQKRRRYSLRCNSSHVISSSSTVESRNIISSFALSFGKVK